MNFVWLTAVKDWRRQRRNPIEMVVWLGIPLLIGGLIILAFGGRGGPQPQAHLLIADEDDSFLSAFLIGALSQEEAGHFIRAEKVQRHEGRDRVAAGNATALLIIPDGFSSAVLNEQPITLKLVTNPAQTILPGIVEETLSILADGTFYLHRLVGDQLRLIAQGPPPGQNRLPDQVVSGMAVVFNRIGDQVSNYLSPPVIKLVDAPAPAEEDTGGVSLGLLFLPSILFMSLLFMAQGLGNDIWQEREQHTLRRVVVTPHNLTQFLAGKLLAAAGMMLLVSVVGLTAGYAYFRLSPITLPLAAFWAMCAGCLIQSLLMTIQLFAPSQRAGNIMTMVLIFPLMMIGGSFFPFEAMPSWMVAVGRWTPNGWSLLLLKRIMLEQATAAELLRSLLMVGGVIGLLFVIGARRLRAGFAQG